MVLRGPANSFAAGLRSHPIIAVWVLVCLWFAQIVAPAQILSPSAPYRTDRILIQPKRVASRAALDTFHASARTRTLRRFEGMGGLEVLQLPAGETVPGIIAKYRGSGLVEFAEPDYLVQLSSTTPNDPKFTDGTLWALNNFGQSGGTPHADIDAVDGWDLLTSASNIVVAVLDTGIRYTHEDLAANMWVNPNNAGHGTNAVSGSNDPNDDNGHGTLVAGVLGAVGNNGKGVTGVAWSVQLMACKCFDSSGNSSDSQIIACVDYARTNGARIINGSFDSTGFSLALSNAIASARDAGIIYVASCGNNSANIDATPHYPAAYGLDNIISVAYTTRTDALGGLSNFGATNVDLAAPGDQIVSTFSATDNFYYPPPNTFNLAGTSFAAPYVSGALALMLARFPTEDYHLIISRLLNGVDPLPALSGKCATGGRLNLRKALSPPIRLTALPSNGGAPFQFVSYVGPNRSNIVQSSSNLISWLPLYTNITTTNWTFDFSDADSTNTTLKFYRVNSAP